MYPHYSMITMKILSINQIRDADRYTIKNEPIASIDLMERAASKCTEWIRERFETSKPFKIFCGPGNNGGDGLVIARQLALSNYRVEVFIVWYMAEGTPDFNANLKRLSTINNVSITDIKEDTAIPLIRPTDVLVDALFGSGLSRTAEGLAGSVIRQMNTSRNIIISIDIPSGLFADQPVIEKDGAIVRAHYTLSFEFPKLAFMLPENEKFVGEWTVLPIGLMDEYVREAETWNYILSHGAMCEMVKTRSRFAHKGQFGHVLIIAGNPGKMGAAVLAAEACLRSGAGLVTVSVPEDSWQILQSSVPEAMISIRPGTYQFIDVQALNSYNSIAVGPGLGTSEHAATALKLLIQSTNLPLILDADALNILAMNKTWLAFLPPGSILTPHLKEFERLAGSSVNGWERLQMQRDFSLKNNVYVILKGANTSITTPGGSCYFNTTGNPGMATAGCGDALTGVLAGLMAQGYIPLETALLGTWVHGLAGDLALEESSFEGLITRDLISKLGKAFRLTSP